jgi:hypothetical protein
MTTGSDLHPKVDENHTGMAWYAQVAVRGNLRKDSLDKGMLTKMV